MGEYDKPHLEFYQDKTILGFIINNLKSDFNLKVVAKNRDEFSDYDVEVLTDLKDAGPLGGIYTGLEMTESKYNFFMGCDMPFINKTLIRWMFNRAKMSDKDGLVPVDGNFYEPLFAIYRKSCLESVEKVILEDRWPIISFYEYINLEFIQKNKLREMSSFNNIFFNINTYEDYLKAKNEILPEYIKMED
ncbi:molybdenum cofactor guanylyltransferase [Halanaerobiaceae bacterium Z-7014]|uniref:Molybdenum cofactor guanylyltransferase n=2 Tax=Halonatronomonas betaini TaxID=2778430 RepID=A0A931ARB9_9FIRM|nr:molybdenum cofactor guanylyltransferase [Halonatronomonas betaini]